MKYKTLCKKCLKSSCKACKFWKPCRANSTVCPVYWEQDKIDNWEKVFNEFNQVDSVTAVKKN